MQTLRVDRNRIVGYSVRKAVRGLCAGIFTAKNTYFPHER